MAAIQVPPTLTSTVLDTPALHEGLTQLCVKKARMPVSKTVILAMLAGAYIGFGCQLSTLILTECPSYGPCKYLAAIGFSVGLMLIFMAGGELFTGNCLLPMAVLDGRIHILEMLRNWGLVWTFNFVGAIIMQAIIFAGAINGTPDDFTKVGTKSCAVYIAKANAEPHRIFFNGISANMLVCSAVIMNAGCKAPSGKFLSALFPVAAFVAMGFEHSIANMNFFAMGVMLDCGFTQQGLWTNIALSTLGNILGAFILASSYWYVYVRSDSPTSKTPKNAPNKSSGATFDDHDLHHHDDDHHDHHELHDIMDNHRHVPSAVASPAVAGV